MPTCVATSPVPSTCWKVAAITAWSTSFTPPPAPCTAPTPTCRSRCTRALITRCRCTRRPSVRTSSWRTTTRRCSRCRPPACGSSRCTVRGGAPTWRYSCSRAIFSRASRSTCSTTATTGATSPTSMTSRKGWCGPARIAQPDPNWDSRAPDPASSSAPFRIYNIGNNQPVQLMRYIEVIEECLGRKAHKNMLPLQLGDVPETFADIDDLVRDVGYRPATPIEVGVKNFVDWFCEYYHYPR